MQPNGVVDNFTYSYPALDDDSDRIAEAILQEQMPSNFRIGICVSRSYDTIAVMMALVKLVCAYVPLAHDIPHLVLKKPLVHIYIHFSLNENITKAVRV